MTSAAASRRRVLSFVHVAGIGSLLGMLSGCGGTLGPVVTDVQWDGKGQLVITRCMLDISSAMNVTTYKIDSCTRTVQTAPNGAAIESPSPSPSNSSATTVYQ